jgi:hypothetical protein
VPFQDPVGYDFSDFAITHFAPPAPGVYGLYSPRRWIYVGQSANLQEALRGQLFLPGPPVARERPSRFTCERWMGDLDARLTREAELIVELRPCCNVGDAATMSSDEFTCRACGHEFEVTSMHLGSDVSEIRCPKCHDKDVDGCWSRVLTLMSAQK